MQKQRRVFGDEDLSMLNPNDFYNGMIRGVKGMLELIEKVHYGPSGTNHNILITTLTGNNCQVLHEESKWMIVNRRDVWEKLITRHYKWIDAFVKVYDIYIGEDARECYELLKKEVTLDNRTIRKAFGQSFTELALKYKKVSQEILHEKPRSVKDEAMEMIVEDFDPAF